MAILTTKRQPRVSVAGDTLSFRFALVKKISAILSTCGSRVLGWPAAIFASTSILLIPLPASAIYVYYGDSKYTTVVGPTWEQAEANAVSLGGHLASIESGEETQFLIDNFKALYQNPDRASIAYIGIDDNASRAWFWTDNTPYSYSAWAVDPYGGIKGALDTSQTKVVLWLENPWDSSYTGKWENGTPDPRGTIKGIAEIKLGSGSSGGTSVPGPLPILGVAAAFAFSRKLRKRIKLHKGSSDISNSTGA